MHRHDYLQQRYYDPGTSRFLTPEPIYSDFCTDCGFTALLNRAPVTSTYAYANDRPTTLVDPDGRWPKFVKSAAHWANHHKLDIALTAAAIAVPEAAGLIWTARAAKAARIAETAAQALRAERAAQAAQAAQAAKRFNPVQQTILREAKEAKRAGGLSRQAGDDLARRARDAGLRGHGPLTPTRAKMGPHTCVGSGQGSKHILCVLTRLGQHIGRGAR